MGIGDRFGRQGKAQLTAFVEARRQGVDVIPVWNKSNREHLIVHTEPVSVRVEADAAVGALSWNGEYHVDADHIGLKTVDRFLAPSDFFTIDVADFIGRPASEDSLRAFTASHAKLKNLPPIAGLSTPLALDADRLSAIARQYLAAVQEAGRIYRHIAAAKGADNFIAEVSMDETDRAQTPVELLVILAAMAAEHIPLQTIAPKFTGRFNKGVDYRGDVAQFRREFNDDLLIINFAVKEFSLPENLKLSVHSGSDKFSIYEAIHGAVRKHGAGRHLKTAGTTWLEELIGLALSGPEGLRVATDVYAAALGRFDELCGPYASVIDINATKLPPAADVRRWTGRQFAAALRHDQTCSAFNPDLRQLLHVGYKVAAEMGQRYLHAVEANEAVISEQVTNNIFERHLKPIFLGD